MCVIAGLETCKLTEIPATLSINHVKQYTNYYENVMFSAILI